MTADPRSPLAPSEMTRTFGRVVAPFTDEQVAALNRYQKGPMHPFTCGALQSEHPVTEPFRQYEEGRTLIAKNDGWHCPTCNYTQDWAHDFMAAAPPSLDALKSTERSEALGVNQEVAASPLVNSKNHGPASNQLSALLDAYRDALIRYAQWAPSSGPDAMKIAVAVDRDTSNARDALVAFYGSPRT